MTVEHTCGNTTSAKECDRCRIDKRALIHMAGMKNEFVGNPSYAYGALLAHLDTTEPALADAIRYGVTKRFSIKIGSESSEWKSDDCFSINYPEGHQNK